MYNYKINIKNFILNFKKNINNIYIVHIDNNFFIKKFRFLIKKLIFDMNFLKRVFIINDYFLKEFILKLHFINNIFNKNEFFIIEIYEDLKKKDIEVINNLIKIKNKNIKILFFFYKLEFFIENSNWFKNILKNAFFLKISKVNNKNNFIINKIKKIFILKKKKLILKLLLNNNFNKILLNNNILKLNKFFIKKINSLKLKIKTEFNYSNKYNIINAILNINTKYLFKLINFYKIKNNINFILSIIFNFINDFIYLKKNFLIKKNLKIFYKKYKILNKNKIIFMKIFNFLNEKWLYKILYIISVIEEQSKGFKINNLFMNIIIPKDNWDALFYLNLIIIKKIKKFIIL